VEQYLSLLSLLVETVATDTQTFLLSTLSAQKVALNVIFYPKEMGCGWEVFEGLLCHELPKYRLNSVTGMLFDGKYGPAIRLLSSHVRNKYG
jgi:hypothetical protein